MCRLRPWVPVWAHRPSTLFGGRIQGPVLRVRGGLTSSTFRLLVDRPLRLGPRSRPTPLPPDPAVRVDPLVPKASRNTDRVPTPRSSAHPSAGSEWHRCPVLYFSLLPGRDKRLSGCAAKEQLAAALHLDRTATANSTTQLVVAPRSESNPFRSSLSPPGLGGVVPQETPRVRGTSAGSRVDRRDGRTDRPRVDVSDPTPPSRAAPYTRAALLD